MEEDSDQITVQQYGGFHALRPLRTMDEFHPDYVPNLLYRIRVLKSIIGDMGDKLQDVQESLPEGDQRAGDIEKFLMDVANTVNSL